jgi:hypothetical protein
MIGRPGRRGPRPNQCEGCLNRARARQVGSACKCDVQVHPEEVRRVVYRLQLREPRVVGVVPGAPSRATSNSLPASRSDPARFSSVAEALDAVGADVLVNYTHASVVKQNVLAAIERGVAVVVGSSGLSVSDYQAHAGMSTTRSSVVIRPEYAWMLGVLRGRWVRRRLRRCRRCISGLWGAARCTVECGSARAA